MHRTGLALALQWQCGIPCRSAPANKTSPLVQFGPTPAAAACSTINAPALEPMNRVPLLSMAGDAVTPLPTSCHHMRVPLKSGGGAYTKPPWLPTYTVLGVVAAARPGRGARGRVL
jgi:hypothetical protein